MARNDGNFLGFTLIPVLLGISILACLAIGVLMLVRTERETSYSSANHQRAELAVQAALGNVRALLAKEMSNDDYIILQSSKNSSTGEDDRQLAPYIFLARVKPDQIPDGKGYVYRYIPLFSANENPPDSLLKIPLLDPFLKESDEKKERLFDVTTLPYQEKVRISWLPVKDETGKEVARYAYWIEDLQGKIDPAIAGNQNGEDLAHKREPWPFFSPGLNPKSISKNEYALNQIALYALDPETTETQQGALGKTLLKNRKMFVSPGSPLAAAECVPPLLRFKDQKNDSEVSGKPGQLIDPKARALEEGTIHGIQSYKELPLIPYALGISNSFVGKPKLNLNQLLSIKRGDAVDQMANFIKNGLPQFESRKGGFPDDYLKTLAANALDYADEDSDSTFSSGSYRGLDAYPLLSEVALQVNYEGIENRPPKKVAKFRIKLFAELYNPTNQPIQSGNVRLSYEVALKVSPIGTGVESPPLDSQVLLDDKTCSVHDLKKINGRYWTPEKKITLLPNQYAYLPFVEVNYVIDMCSSDEKILDGTRFGLTEELGASGISLLWNGTVVDRAEKIIRKEGLEVTKVKQADGRMIDTDGFEVGGQNRTLTKACLPGYVYDGPFPTMYYNMGDPRITYYLREAPLAENAFPGNMSPNRRNIRQQIYRYDDVNKPKTYARVLPSEWPDCGHNVSVGGEWTMGTNDKEEFSDFKKYGLPYDEKMKESAIQMISNRGRFFSNTELGKIFDPVMYRPVFLHDVGKPEKTKDNKKNVTDTSKLLEKGLMPLGESWPDVIEGQGSVHYGGGNTLRIGRPEHSAFDKPEARDMHAVRLLDLFHVGISRSGNETEREGSVVLIEGHVNLNTASRDVIRALAAGKLVMDPAMSEQSNTVHDKDLMRPPIKDLSLDAPTFDREKKKVLADLAADVILQNRPYVTPSDIVFGKDENGSYVFGNKEIYPLKKKIEWSDAAAEEVFARVYESSTVRSRNFRVWVIGQTLSKELDQGGKQKILGEVRKNFIVFADPGERGDDGKIERSKFKMKVLSCNEF